MKARPRAERFVASLPIHPIVTDIRQQVLSANAYLGMARLPFRHEEDAVSETMQAVVCHGPKDYRLEEVPVPKLGRGQALVRSRRWASAPAT